MIILYFRFFTSESDKKENSSDLVRKKYFQRKKKGIFDAVRNGGSRREARSGSRRHSYGIPIARSPMAFPVPTTYPSFEIRSARGRGGGGREGGRAKKGEEEKEYEEEEGG